MSADEALDDEEDEQTKDVYAHFGLAMYFAQVLEHGVVNAMVIARTPDRHRITRAEIDAFRAGQFERTLGQMLRELGRYLVVTNAVESTLREALERRNWLAHDYFRDRAVAFMSPDGRASMLKELQESTALFREADEALHILTAEIRRQLGIDDAAIDAEVKALLHAVP